MAEHSCPNCGKAFQIGDEVCRFCGFVFPFSTVVIPVGRLLHGRYEIQELIHTGGMGYIYLAKDKVLFDRLCIVKQVRESIQSEAHQKKLEEEALSMAKLTHPNIAMILDHFVEGGYYFLVVERISGKTLSEVVKDRRGQFTEREVLDWATTICDVVTYLHSKGVIHRDISPDNIMLTEENAIKFIDFGTSHEFRFFGSAGTVGIGKYGYTPPEQWRGKPEQRSDIFALGATIYYLLTDYLPLSQEFLKGQSPQKEDYNPVFPPVRTKNPNVSPKLEAVLQKALQLDIDKRYATAAEFCQALKSVTTGGKKSVAPVQKAKKVHAPKTNRRSKVELALIWGSIGIIIVVAIILGLPRLISTNAEAPQANTTCFYGYIKDAVTNAPITDAYIEVYEPFNSSVGSSLYKLNSSYYPDSSGYYRTDNLTDSVPYSVKVSATGYVTQWYQNALDKTHATPLTLKSGESFNIDFLMTKSGSISGKISSGATTITALNPTTGETVASYTIIEGVSYKFGGLPAGEYYIKASNGIMTLYYNNALSITTATVVKVTSSQDTPNIDFSLSSTTVPPPTPTPVPGSNYVQGYVFNAVTNVPVTDAIVDLLERITTSTNHSYDVIRASGYSDNNGYYKIGSVNGSGKYLIRVSAIGYVTQWYINAVNRTQASLITFKPGETFNTSFFLIKSGSISGRFISSITGETLFISIFADIAVYDATGQWLFTNKLYLDTEGKYSITNLAPGYYYIRVISVSGTVYYKDSPDLSTATLVEVTSGQDTPNINFILTPTSTGKSSIFKQAKANDQTYLSYPVMLPANLPEDKLIL